jgi:hypothetical protein
MDSSFGDTDALMASAVPPLLWSGYELAKTRRLDAISAIIVAGILLTVGATALGGSPRLIQIRDALVTGFVGLVFLASLALKKPIVFYLARATSARNTMAGEAAFEEMWNRPGVPGAFRMLTVVWGFGLVGQTAIMCWLALVWPVNRYLLLSPPIGYGILALLFAWSLWFAAKRKALAELARAHAAAKRTQG